MQWRMQCRFCRLVRVMISRHSSSSCEGGGERGHRSTSANTQAAAPPSSNMNKLTDGCEINTNTDTSNCGGCGMACSTINVATPSCSGGMCNGACNAGYANWYALVSELTCSSQCVADEEERRLAVTAPSGPTAATSTRKPTPATVAAVAWLAAPSMLPHHRAAAECATAHAMPVMPIGMLWYLS